MSSYYTIPANQKNMNKDDVVTWFRMLSGSQRIETLCALLDCCVPFEVRFIGSVIEDLGRRDFHELRDVENKANHFTQGNKTPEANKLALYNSLAAEPGQPVPTNPQGNVPQYGPASNANSSLSHQSIQLNSAFAVSQDVRNNRPSPTHNKDGKTRGWSYENQQMLPGQSQPKSSTSQANSPLVNGSCLPTKGVTNSSSNCSAEDENDEDLRNSPPSGGGDLLVLSVDRTRQRMILYLALLTCTNREASSAFYALMSQVEQTVGAPGWLEGLEEIVLEEVALLYTLGAHHPAFSFEQRIMLSEILAQVRSQLYKQRMSRSYPNYYMPYDPKFGHYYVQYVPTQPVPQVQPQLSSSGTQAPPQQQLSQPVVAGSNVVSVPQGVDASRIPPQAQVPQITYYQPVPYPAVYMTSQHPQHQHHLQLVGNPVPRNIVPAPPLQSPRTAGVPIPNPGPVQTEKYRSVKPDSSQNLIDDDDTGLPPLNEVNITAPAGSARRISCFNCGESTHSGTACPIQRMEEITQGLYRVKFTGSNDSNPSPPTDSSS